MSIREIGWPEVAGRIQRRIIRPPDVNPHIAVLAKTGSGKDHMIRWGILPAFPLERVIVLILKPGGDRTWNGTPGGPGPYGNLIKDPRELRPGFGRGADGTPRYRIPLEPARTSRDQVRRLLEQLAAEGEMILVIGDAARLTTRAKDGGLDLERHVSNMMTEGREVGLPVIASANSASWAAGGIKDQAAAVMIGQAGGDMRKEFADIANLPSKGPGSEARAAIDRLRAHWWLYTDHADGDLRACITHPPPAGSVDERGPWAEEPGPELAQLAERVAGQVAQLAIAGPGPDLPAPGA
jgi:hypothetical protein